MSNIFLNLRNRQAILYAVINSAFVGAKQKATISPTQPKSPNPFASPWPSESDRAQYSFQVSSKAIASGLFLGLLSSFSTIVIAPPTITLAQSLLNQVSKARQNEAKQSISALNQAQQLYYAQNGKFATTIKQLAISLPTETKNYRYQIVPQDKNRQRVKITAQAKPTELKSYTGALFAIARSGKKTIVTAICETNQPSSKLPAMPSISASNRIKCANGSHQL